MPASLRALGLRDALLSARFDEERQIRLRLFLIVWVVLEDEAPLDELAI
jgi:hypothetical protein